MIAMARLGLRFLPVPRLQQGLCRVARRLSRGRERADGPTIVRSVLVASRRVPFGSHCLARALAAQSLLEANGIASELHLGVRTRPTFNAHAWLVCASQVILGQLPDLEEYLPLPDLRWRER
jgi:hypothetical protein